MQFDALLFDLDGTLVDSTEAVVAAWAQWAKRHQLNENDVLNFVHGRPASESIAHFLPQADSAMLKIENDWLEELESTDLRGTVAMPGAVELISDILQRKLPWAVVTSGTTRVASARLKAAKLSQPQVFITADKVTRGKPDPQPYLLAAQMLAVAPEKSVVFEDAPSGIHSGKSAGCMTIGISGDMATHLPETDMLIHSLQEVKIEADQGQAKLVFAGLN